MCKQIFLLFLFPLALNAQQPQTTPTLFRTAFFFADDSNLALAPGPDTAPERNSLPNAPEPRALESPAGESAPMAGVYEQVRRAPEPQAPASGAVWNKKLIVAHAAFLGSIVYDAELTHQGLAHHSCEEANPNFGPQPSRGELYRKNMLVFGVISGLDWFTAKAKLRYLPYLGPAAGTAVHLVGGSKWLAECW